MIDFQNTYAYSTRRCRVTPGYTNYMKYYEVAPFKLVRPQNAVFTYASEQPLAKGLFVKIPLGKAIVNGIVIDEVGRPAHDTKTITEVLDISPLPLPILQTALWMSEYYATHLAVVLQTILPRGIAKKRRQSRGSDIAAKRNRTLFLLNKDQLSAVNQITEMSTGSAILHGITGSGKTAVYIELAKQSLQKGESVIMLVPEIALTSQLVAEFKNYFDDIILTHSRQTESERHLAWLEAINSSVPRIVIGPRSALFMPVPNVKLILIDEAHEPSYKQEQSPRYSALRVASVLCSHTKGKVVQGSATPLLTEYYTAKAMGRPIITMANKARPGTTEPLITVVDMTKKQAFSEHRLFSDTLLSSMREAINNQQQALVFHNRRGSASTTLCEGCGWSAICERCFVPYTLHADLHKLRCHICGGGSSVPTWCPVCHSTAIIHKGIGTKLIESELRRLFPQATIARFDGDNTAIDTVESRYNELYDGSINIIIGTQVIAKGLDLPHLRLVGVVQADAGLTLPDYAASERTFQLLAQVVGRVGRSSHQSKIILQSYQPTAPSVQLGVSQNYQSFYSDALAERKRANFPPFCYLLKLTCTYKTEAAAIRNAQALAKKLQAAHNGISVFGPAPAFYERKRDSFRWQIVVKSRVRADLIHIVHDLPPQWQFDLDPSSLL